MGAKKEGAKRQRSTVGSNMKIKSAGAAAVSPGSKVKSVHEAKADFRIEFEDGSSATFFLADPGSSVAVRDKNNAVEYLG